jgi:hypothetical protein
MEAFQQRSCGLGGLQIIILRLDGEELAVITHVYIGGMLIVAAVGMALIGWVAIPQGTTIKLNTRLAIISGMYILTV